MDVNRYIFWLLIVLSTMILVSGIYYFGRTKQLERQIAQFEHSLDYNHLDKITNGIFLESLKKLKIGIDDVKNMFTFHGTVFLWDIDETDIPWQAFDYNNIDMEYSKSYDKIMLLGYDVFFLFKDSVLIDYRYNGCREYVNNYLKSDGILPIEQ
jgi:hypothetical protein